MAQKQKCTKDIYCQFLIAAQSDYTATGLADGMTSSNEPLAHDAVTRWQKYTKLTPSAIWQDVEPLIEELGGKDSGWLVIDDMTIEKNKSYKLPMSSWHWSGSAHGIVRGLNVVNLFWTGDGQEHIPVDFRLYAKKGDGMTRNQHMKDMLRLAQHRGFKPKAVVFDTWYSSVDNLNLITDLGWTWYCPIRANRIVNYTQHLEELDIPKDGLIVHLKMVGPTRVFKFNSKDGDIEYWATNNLDATPDDISIARAKRWSIEEFHRGLKQTVGIGKCQARNDRAQRNHICCCIRSFVVLEIYRLRSGISWYEAKRSIVRDAIRQYLQRPQIPLPGCMVCA